MLPPEYGCLVAGPVVCIVLGSSLPASSRSLHFVGSNDAATRGSLQQMEDCGVGSANASAVMRRRQDQFSEMKVVQEVTHAQSLQARWDSEAKQSKAKQSRAKQSRAEQSRAEKHACWKKLASLLPQEKFCYG